MFLSARRRRGQNNPVCKIRRLMVWSLMSNTCLLQETCILSLFENTCAQETCITKPIVTYYFAQGINWLICLLLSADGDAGAPPQASVGPAAKSLPRLHVNVCVCIYIYIYVYWFTYSYMYLSLSLSIYIYIYICCYHWNTLPIITSHTKYIV